MSWNPFEERRSRVLVVLALVSLGFVSGAEWWRWHASPDPRDGRLRPGSRVRLSANPPGTPSASEAFDEGLDPADLTYEDFLAALTSRKSHPAAIAFARDFLGDPELRRAWAELHHAKDGRALRSALAELRDSDRFAALMARYEDDLQFKALAHDLMRDPSIRALIREDEAVRQGRPGVLRERGRAVSSARLNIPAVGRAVDARAARQHLFGFLSKADRQKLGEFLDGSGDLQSACAAAGIGEACNQATSLCSRDAGCRRALSLAAPPAAPLPVVAPNPPAVGTWAGAAPADPPRNPERRVHGSFVQPVRGGAVNTPPPSYQGYSPPPGGGSSGGYSGGSSGGSAPAPAPSPAPAAPPPGGQGTLPVLLPPKAPPKGPPPPPPPSTCSCNCSGMTPRACQSCLSRCAN
ncbi:MAG: hypothetical protein HY553_14925 [Elusimicrobia bacterium]|nr:hypothetical protein [Elusimicrobiota bacterium]